MCNAMPSPYEQLDFSESLKFISFSLWRQGLSCLRGIWGGWLKRRPRGGSETQQALFRQHVDWFAFGKQGRASNTVQDHLVAMTA